MHTKIHFFCVSWREELSLYYFFTTVDATLVRAGFESATICMLIPSSTFTTELYVPTKKYLYHYNYATPHTTHERLIKPLCEGVYMCVCMCVLQPETAEYQPLTSDSVLTLLAHEGTGARTAHLAALAHPAILTGLDAHSWKEISQMVQ